MLADIGKLNGEGNGNPLQCSCLAHLMDRGIWRVTVRGVTQSQTRLSQEAHRGKRKAAKALHSWRQGFGLIAAELSGFFFNIHG